MSARQAQSLLKLLDEPCFVPRIAALLRADGASRQISIEQKVPASPAWRMCSHRNGHTCAISTCVRSSHVLAAFLRADVHPALSAMEAAMAVLELTEPKTASSRKATGTERGRIAWMLLRAHHSKYVRCFAKTADTTLCVSPVRPELTSLAPLRLMSDNHDRHLRSRRLI